MASLDTITIVILGFVRGDVRTKEPKDGLALLCAPL
jgi:hypothetical protein